MPNERLGSAGITDEHRAEVMGPLATIPGGESVTLAEAAKLAGVSEATLHRRIAEGQIPASRDGRAWRIQKSVILEFGPMRKPDIKTQNASIRGELAGRCFPRFAAGIPLPQVVIELLIDPKIVRELFIEWCSLCDMSARFLAQQVPPAPQFDHAPNVTWDCCPGHSAQHRMEHK